jgi:hypothetical protein
MFNFLDLLEEFKLHDAKTSLSSSKEIDQQQSQERREEEEGKEERDVVETKVVKEQSTPATSSSVHSTNPANAPKLYEIISGVRTLGSTSSSSSSSSSGSSGSSTSGDMEMAYAFITTKCLRKFWRDRIQLGCVRMRSIHVVPSIHSSTHPSI